MLAEKRKLLNIIRYMPEDKIKRLVKMADELDDELTPEEFAELEAAKAEIARGEWISFDEIRRREGL